jgi:hypothetical protein
MVAKMLAIRLDFLLQIRVMGDYSTIQDKKEFNRACRFIGSNQIGK